MAILTKSSYLIQTFTSEDRFTAVTNMYVSHNYQELRGFYFHIPNESQKGQHRVKGVFGAGDRERIEQAAKGVLPGVPDFCFMLPYVWYLELKVLDNGLSPAQKTLHPRWKDRGIVIHVAWTPSQVCKALEGMVGMPTYP